MWSVVSWTAAARMLSLKYHTCERHLATDGMRDAATQAAEKQDPSNEDCGFYAIFDHKADPANERLRAAQVEEQVQAPSRPSGAQT